MPRTTCILVGTLYAAIVIVASLIHWVPQASDITESVILFCAAACGGTVIIACLVHSLRYYVWHLPQARPLSSLTFWLVGAFCLFGIAVWMPGTFRSFENDILRPEISGVVTRVYRSDNHQYKSIEITNGDGSTLRLEGIDATAWSSIQTGAPISKPAWSAVANVGDKSIRLLQ